jgi:hypothetical protein
MRGLEVHLNGRKLCTAGIGPDAVLNTIVDVVGRKDEVTGDDYHMMMRVGGLENEEFLIWARNELRVGDEISIRIVEHETFDSPIERKTQAEALGD